ncbi:lipopolysaccharide biosynthesis protein, partial [Streptomyces sp. SR27]|nr:lipopolysaccharide biosynthesis protein [Streptomyces sp. SR27]
AVRSKPRAEDGYGTNWARESAYLRGAHDSVTPAFGIPVFVPRPEGVASPSGADASGRTEPSPNGPEDAPGRTATRRGPAPGPVLWLWTVLGLAAGLFWFPLVRSGELSVERLSGTGLLTALPPVTLAAGLLLVALQGAAVALRVFRPVFAGTVLLATFLALHTAPPLLGLRPAEAGGPGAVLLGEGLERAVTPVALQALSLLLVALLLRVVGVGSRVTAGVVWVLVWAGWAGQQAFAAAPLPLFLGLAGGTMAVCAFRGLTSGGLD